MPQILSSLGMIDSRQLSVWVRNFTSNFLPVCDIHFPPIMLSSIHSHLRLWCLLLPHSVTSSFLCNPTSLHRIRHSPVVIATVSPILSRTPRLPSHSFSCPLPGCYSHCFSSPLPGYIATDSPALFRTPRLL